MEKFLTKKHEWRDFFPKRMVKEAQDLVDNGDWDYFDWDENTAEARMRKSKRSPKWYTISIEHMPQSYSDAWDTSKIHCTCQSRNASFWGEEACMHKAALLLRIEEEHGPWKFTETIEEQRERLEEEQKEREKERRKRQKEKEGKIEAFVKEVLPIRAEGKPIPYYNLNEIITTEKTSLYCRHLMEDILRTGKFLKETGEISYLENRRQVLHSVMEIFDGVENHTTEIAVSYHNVEHRECTCRSGYSYYYHHDVWCEHELVLLKRMWDDIEQHNPGDATDLAAEDFFELLSGSNIVLDVEEEQEAVKKEKKVVILPRITMENGLPKLSFKIGLTDGKLFVLKNFSEFVSAIEAEEVFQLGKNAYLDFHEVVVTEESEPWLTFIQRRVGETEHVNDRLNMRSSYFYRAPTLSVQSQEILEGSTLDRFYDLAEGKKCEYQSRGLGIKGIIRVGHADMRVRLQTKKMLNEAGEFIGISVTGIMPVILEGVAGNYILDEKHLSRISREEHMALIPFRQAASGSGEIRFQVGTRRLSEFYYRAVPNLLESRYVDFEDSCAEIVQEYLPPEPEFLFRLDMEDDICICRASVSYSIDRDSVESSKMLWRYSLPEGEILKKPSEAETYQGGGYRDTLQEERVLGVLEKSFANYDMQQKGYVSEQDPSGDALYRILTEVIPLLNRYGEVQGTEAFRKNTIKPVPQVKMGVSIESGVMDISILSKDMEPQELLEILHSYRKKKKYYRLKSGDFIDLSGDNQLASLDDMMYSLDLSSEDIIRGNVKIPTFRALYLDKMLEAHEELVADRDKTYRALLKNFRTIRDADYEPAADVVDVLRPYQMYGFKWLRTMAAVGFGGILADEMGLGKTLQMISMIESLFEEGEALPCLVVCPASLVFNWQEEFQRFAPKIPVCTVTGTMDARKQIYAEMKKQLKNSSDAAASNRVYIISYDLLRKDIVKYENMIFSVMVLDEAQYIKNQNAAVTKAVKIVQAKHRFALTGTPIENRLAELWSIFDFLMPGFLYKYDEFSSKYETPITKEKNEEKAGRLKQMVGPFILRRLKTDVLKDLPVKLEEVRYARFDAEQRKVYDGQVVHMKQMISGQNADRIKVFAELMRIRQICCDPSLYLENYKGGSAKRQACMELVKSAIEGGHKILLFSQFTSMLAILENDLKKEKISFYKITGSTPKEKRVRLVREFNENDVPVFLISLKAGGTGLNLTGADVVIHYDPWWNVAAQNQATDRAHRIGQEKQVTVYRLIVKDTIEEKILALQEAKRDLADAILSGDSESIYTLSSEELLELL